MRGDKHSGIAKRKKGFTKPPGGGTNSFEPKQKLGPSGWGGTEIRSSGKWAESGGGPEDNRYKKRKLGNQSGGENEGLKFGYLKLQGAIEDCKL